MARVHLVRHARPAAGWDADPDPGLDERGRRQAEAVADRLVGELTPRPVVSSPLRRTQETAAPLADRWGSVAAIERAVTEIPSPTEDLVERRAWLDGVLAGRWDRQDEPVERWRAGVVEAVRAMAVDTVVVTHFVAVNAVVAAALGRPDVCTFLPGHASVTVVDVDAGGALEVVALGSEAAIDLR